MEPEHLNVMFNPDLAVPIFGYTVPPLAVCVILINICMVWILLQKQMKSPVNTLLVCIAISDTLAITLPAIPFTYFYSLGHYENFVPFAWCRVFFYCVHVLPLLCNMASLWTTVALAVMRCYSVWRPLHAKSTITTSRTYIAVFVVYVMSALAYAPLMFEYTYTPLTAPSMTEQNTTILSCHMQKSQTHTSVVFCRVHTWVQIIMTSLLPWFLITFPDFGLLYKLKKSDNERKALSGNVGSKCVSVTESLNKKHQAIGKRMTSWMVFCVVSMIWLVEIPFAINFTMYMSHTDGNLMRSRVSNNVVVVFLLKYITYPIVFLIFCFMSKKFRDTFYESVLRKRRGIYSPTTSKRSFSSTKECEPII